MPPTNERPPAAAVILALGRRIAAPDSRRFFMRFCREICRFSDDMRAETSSFDITFRDDTGFSVVVSPHRDLFVVSLGEDRSSDIRVSSAEGFCFALDSALRRRLADASAAAGAP